MTNYNYKKAILTTFLILSLFTSAIAIGSIPNAYAGALVVGDSNPPDYRGDDDSVFAAWQSFSICLDPNGDLEPDGRPPPGNGFPVDPILFNAIEASGDLFDDDPTIEFEDQLPVQKVYHLTMPNIVDDLDTKNVRIQITTCNTFGPEDLTPVQFGDFGALDDGESVEILFDGDPIITPLNGFTHFTQDFEIHPNPDIEFFEFFIPGDAELVSVIVDTVSFSEDIPVHIDIKPQSCPNPISTNSRGVVPVAILGSADFDVSQIDVSTIQLEGVSPMKHNIEDVATPHMQDTAVVNPNDCTIEGPDGFDDLTLKFDAQRFVAALGPVSKGQVIQVGLHGLLLDGTPFESYDVIIIK